MIYCHKAIPCPATARGSAARVFKPGQLFTHLSADSEDELLEFAQSIGMNKRWIQNPGTSRFHFDVSLKFLNKVLADDRVEVLSTRDFIKRLRDKARLVSNQ